MSLMSTSLNTGRAASRWNRSMALRVVPVLVVLIVLVCGAIFLVRNWGQVRDIGPALRHAHHRWIVVALVCQVLVELLIAQKFRLIFRRLGHSVPRLTLMRSHLYRHVLATIIPFGGIPAMYGFARDLNAAKVPTERALFAVLLSSLASEIAFLSILLPTLLVLAMQGSANHYFLIGTLIVVGFTLAIVLALVWAHRASGLESGRCQWLRRRIVPMMAQMQDHQIRSRDIFWPVILALGINLCGIMLMEAVLQAVSVQPSLMTVVAARVLASVVMLLAPIFQGAGAVEFTTVGILVSGGVPVSAALAAAVLFRVCQFWFPLAAGSLARVVPMRPPLPTVHQRIET